jgi:hypothetical protein
MGMPTKQQHIQILCGKSMVNVLQPRWLKRDKAGEVQ